MIKDYESWKEQALACGFSHVGPLNVDTIEMHKEARDACAENKCHMYGKNWSCPPGCGTLEECEARLRKYKDGLILQTTCEMEDAFDFEAMADLGERHQKAFKQFAELIRAVYPGCMILGMAGCENCKECTYPDNPCRFPDKMTSAMEGYGMIVSEVCQRNDIKYYYGPGTLTYVGCVLVK